MAPSVPGISKRTGPNWIGRLSHHDWQSCVYLIISVLMYTIVLVIKPFQCQFRCGVQRYCIYLFHLQLLFINTTVRVKNKIIVKTLKS